MLTLASPSLWIVISVKEARLVLRMILGCDDAIPSISADPINTQRGIDSLNGWVATREGGEGGEGGEGVVLVALRCAARSVVLQHGTSQHSTARSMQYMVHGTWYMVHGA